MAGRVPSKSELQRQNEARIQANLGWNAARTPENVLSTWGTEPGDRGCREPEAKASKPRKKRWGQTIKAMQPSSELTGQEQLGPVQQAPMFDWMRQFDQPPTPMANAVFQPHAASATTVAATA